MFGRQSLLAGAGAMTASSAMALAPWPTFLERTGAMDGCLDNPGYQAAMDSVLDALRVAVRRG